MDHGSQGGQGVLAASDIQYDLVGGGRLAATCSWASGWKRPGPF